MGNTEYLIGAEKWRDLRSIGMVESKRIPELGTIQWANDADLDADVLYAAVSGQAIADFDQLISTVEGDVIKLYRPRKARVDKITVQDTISKRQVQIDLPEREYAIATSAHQQQKLIICYENLAVSIIKSNHVMYFVRSQYSDNNHIKIG